MKKLLIPSLTILLGLGLTACDDSKESPTENYGDSIATLIIPANADENATAQMVQYTFQFDYGNKMAKLGINGLRYKDVDYKFLGENLAFTYNDYYNGRIQNINVGMIPNSNGGTSATNVRAQISTMLNFRPSLMVDMMPVFRQYVIDYTVSDIFSAKTFAANSYYFGQTMTTYVYNDQHKEFSTEKPIYNVVMDLAKGTATVSIYNPVFAEEMPPSMANTEMQLQGLKIEYQHDSYRVVGENIIPRVREGALMVPNERFIFNNFTLVANSTDLRRANISFKVAGRYDGAANVTTDLNRNNQ